MKNVLFFALTLLLTGGTLQALTDDEIYAYADNRDLLGQYQRDQAGEKEMITLIYELPDLSAEDRTKLDQYFAAITAVEKDLNASTMQKVLPRIPAVLIGLFIGGPVAMMMDGALGDRIGNWDVGMGKIVLSLLTYHYGSKRVIGTKINKLKRIAVEALLRDDGTYTRALTILKWWHHFHRFVNTLLLTIGGMGVVRVATN